jgi:hypothetical protein
MTHHKIRKGAHVTNECVIAMRRSSCPHSGCTTCKSAWRSTSRRTSTRSCRRGQRRRGRTNRSLLRQSAARTGMPAEDSHTPAMADAVSAPLLARAV